MFGIDLSSIGSFLGVGGHAVPQFQVDQNAYKLQDAGQNAYLLRKALQDSQNTQAAQAAPGYSAQTVANQSLAPYQQAAFQAGPTGLDASQANQAAAQQAQLANMQLATASGQGPSVAQQQLMLGNQQNQAGLLSAAGSLRGGANPALQQRQLMDALAQSNQGNNAQAGMLRAQEALNAQQAAGQTLGTSRGQSLDQASTNATLAGQAAQNFNQNSQFNASGQNQYALNQANLNQTNMQNNAAMTNSASQAGLAQSLANAQMRQNQQQANQQNVFGAIGGLTNLDAAQTNAASAGAAAQQNAYESFAGRKQGINTTNAAFGANLVNQAVQGGAGMAFSDERLKTDVDRKEMSSSMRSFLDAVDPASYRYKKPEHGEGRKWGVMAQSLQKSEAGKSLVKETPEGLAIDTRMGFGTLLAAVKDVHERTKRLERSRA